MQSDVYFQYKEKAIALRKEGRVYSEILALVPVAKSTLSLWLREVGLAKRQIQRITDKKREAQMKAAHAKRAIRQKRQQNIYNESKEDIVSSMTPNELFLFGIALYWAEGNKEKEYRTGSSIGFSNSDPRMIRVFLRWLGQSVGIEKNRIDFDVYIHELSRGRTKEVQKYWSDQTGFSNDRFRKIYYKKGNPKTNRKNTGDLYYGILRVKVCASSDLVRRIEGWVQAICDRFEINYWGIV